MNDNDDQSFGGPHDIKSAVARLEERVQNLRKDLKELDDLTALCLTRIEFMAHFWPVRALVYGMAALLLSSVLAAIIAVVITKTPT